MMSRTDILVVGEAPTGTGTWFSTDPEVKLLRALEILSTALKGLSPAAVVRTTYLVPKRLPRNRKPHKAEILAHRGEWQGVVQETGPRMILACGKHVVNELITGTRVAKRAITVRDGQHQTWWLDPDVHWGGGGDLIPVRVTWRPRDVVQYPRLQPYWFQALEAMMKEVYGG